MIEFCPLCIKNGYKRKIILNQINLQEAVWLCEYSECPFPFGYQDFTFVSRRVGETWSSDWELGKSSMLKSSESFQISLSELGLDTPPVTPGSGTDTQKDLVFGEGSCSGTSLNLSGNNVVQTKANSGLSKNGSSRVRQSYASECGSIETESTGTRISGEIFASATSNKSNNKDSGSLGNDKIPEKLKSGFSLCDDVNLESLNKDLLSSQGFIDACNTAEALTESVFNVETPSKDNFSIHESTVKCKKWLSDNTKSVIVRDHCYSSPEFKKVTVESGNVLLKEVGSGRPERSRVENLNSRKQLPRIKSIEKTNVKLAGVINGSNKTRLRKNSHSAQRKIASKNTDDSIILSENSSESFRVENEISLEIDGLLPINESYEVPNFVEKIITVPWSVESGGKIKEDNVIIDSSREPVVNNSVPSIGAKINAVDCLESESNQSSFRVENKILEIDGFLPINVSYEIPNFSEECTTAPWSVESGEKRKEDNVIIALSREPVVHKSVPSIGTKIGAVDFLESESNQSTISSNTEPQRQSMKKPLKRSIPKPAKYQGFNFGTLKKKSKTNAVHSEENIKFSLPNIPSPDNASCCSDLTWTSETSCATTATGNSKSESVGSSIDRNSTSTSMFVENCIPATSPSSESKMMNTISPEINRVLEANFNLDQVLDECLRLDDIKDSNQNWDDDFFSNLLN